MISPPLPPKAVKDACPSCGKTMFKVSGKGQRKPFCINTECENFLPEDKRGYRNWTKKTDDAKTAEEKPKAKRGRPKKEAKA